jgi:hypothetical protein
MKYTIQLLGSQDCRKQHIAPSFNPAFIGEYATATSLNGENYLYKSDIGVLN